MISHAKRFLFVHIPKTGGTSVSKALSPYGLFLQGERNYESIYFKHAAAADLKRMLGDEFDRYFSFTIVRNPWDWVASNYAFNRGLHRPWTRGTEFSVSGTVPDWAASWDFKTWLPWWLANFSPQQSRMLTDGKGTLLVDRVLRLEELSQEFPRLCAKLDVPAGPLPHERRNTDRQVYDCYYDHETQARVEEHFREDIERFGYCYEGITG